MNSYTDSELLLPVFNVDNRGESLFVEIIFDKKISTDLTFNSEIGNQIADLYKKLAFVTIKNGKHDGIGYIFSNQILDLTTENELKESFNFIKGIALKNA